MHVSIHTPMLADKSMISVRTPRLDYLGIEQQHQLDVRV